jgi:N utilization substance protein B
MPRSIRRRLNTDVSYAVKYLVAIRQFRFICALTQVNVLIAVTYVVIDFQLKEILKYIFGTIIMGSQNTLDYIDEHFSNWEDEGDLMIGLVLNYIQKPTSVDFNDLVGDEKAKFAKDLLATVIDKKQVTEEIITPKLKNWDPERIAMIDMILLRLGVCELLYFDTIPTKVTINEYIDLAKDYSTEQSGQFVNGILDNIHKELVAKGQIQKINHKAK